MNAGQLRAVDCLCDPACQAKGTGPRCGPLSGWPLLPPRAGQPQAAAAARMTKGATSEPGW